MDGRQRLKLTGTNHSIGLILCCATRSGKPAQDPTRRNKQVLVTEELLLVWFDVRRGDLVVMARFVHPIPFRTRA